jgi:hypothetical protein
MKSEVRTIAAGVRRPSASATSRWLLAALLALAALVALAACGKDAGKGATTNSAAAEAGRRYAQCMRDNGAPDFPDPDVNGKFRGQGHEQQNDPKFRAAMEKCRDLAPGGEHQNTGGPAFVEQIRKYSQCMRYNGVPYFPDPEADGQRRGAGHEQQNDPKFRAAMEKCRDKLPGGGNHG